MVEEHEYGQLRAKLIRARTAMDITNDNLSNVIQAKAKLTLTEAAQLSGQGEARKESQSLIRGNTETVHYMKWGCHKHCHHPSHSFHHFSSSHSSSQPPKPKPHQDSNPVCKKYGYCRKEPHSWDKCPARHATCTFCGQKGRYQAVCCSIWSVLELVATLEDFL